MISKMEIGLEKVKELRRRADNIEAYIHRKTPDTLTTYAGGQEAFDRLTENNKRLGIPENITRAAVNFYSSGSSLSPHLLYKAVFILAKAGDSFAQKMLEKTLRSEGSDALYIANARLGEHYIERLLTRRLTEEDYQKMSQMELR